MTVIQNFQTGLTITALGMALVLLALVVVMVAIVIVDRLFRPGPEDEEWERAIMASAAAGSLVAGQADWDASGEAAAIAVALELERRRQKISRYHKDAQVVTVTTIDPGHGIWRGYGRIRSMN